MSTSATDTMAASRTIQYQSSAALPLSDCAPSAVHRTAAEMTSTSSLANLCTFTSRIVFVVVIVCSMVIILRSTSSHTGMVTSCLRPDSTSSLSRGRAAEPLPAAQSCAAGDGRRGNGRPHAMRSTWNSGLGSAQIISSHQMSTVMLFAMSVRSGFHAPPRAATVNVCRLTHQQDYDDDDDALSS